MKYVFTTLLILFTAATYSQQTVVRATKVIATQNLQPPGDTLVSPSYIGELRWKTSDSTLYAAKALTGASKWTPCGGFFTIQNSGGGTSLLNPNSTATNLKFKTILAGVGIFVYPTDSTVQVSIDVTDISITTGTSTTLSGSQYYYNIAINPPSVISTYTINFPPNPGVNTTISLTSGGTMTSGTTVTTLTINGNGHTIIGTNPTTLAAGSTTYTWKYNFSTGFWYKL